MRNEDGVIFFLAVPLLGMLVCFGIFSDMHMRRKLLHEREMKKLQIEELRLKADIDRRGIDFNKLKAEIENE